MDGIPDTATHIAPASSLANARAARTPLMLAALNGAFAVAFGTAGAHLITEPTAKGWLLTAAIFELAHAAAAIGIIALLPGRMGRAVAWLMGAGALVFAVTLALMAFGFPRWLGAITPAGGTAMLLGWLLLAGAAAGIERRA